MKKNIYKNNVHFRLNEEEMKKLNEIMKITNTTKSKVMRMIINSYYDNCFFNKEVL